MYACMHVCMATGNCWSRVTTAASPHSTARCGRVCRVRCCRLGVCGVWHHAGVWHSTHCYRSVAGGGVSPHHRVVRPNLVWPAQVTGLSVEKTIVFTNLRNHSQALASALTASPMHQKTGSLLQECLLIGSRSMVRPQGSGQNCKAAVNCCMAWCVICCQQNMMWRPCQVFIFKPDMFPEPQSCCMPSWH